MKRTTFFDNSTSASQSPHAMAATIEDLQAELRSLEELQAQEHSPMIAEVIKDLRKEIKDLSKTLTTGQRGKASLVVDKSAVTCVLGAHTFLALGLFGPQDTLGHIFQLLYDYRHKFPEKDAVLVEFKLLLDDIDAAIITHLRRRPSHLKRIHLSLEAVSKKHPDFVKDAKMNLPVTHERVITLLEQVHECLALLKTEINQQQAYWQTEMAAAKNSYEQYLRSLLGSTNPEESKIYQTKLLDCKFHIAETTKLYQEVSNHLNQLTQVESRLKAYTKNHPARSFSSS